MYTNLSSPTFSCHILLYIYRIFLKKNKLLKQEKLNYEREKKKKPFKYFSNELTNILCTER